MRRGRMTPERCWSRWDCSRLEAMTACRHLDWLAGFPKVLYILKIVNFSLRVSRKDQLLEEYGSFVDV